MEELQLIKPARVCWLDLEMTGLDVRVDKILEIAALVSDFDNNILFKGLHSVIHYEKSDLPLMDAWVTQQHTRSRLFEAVEKSPHSLSEIEDLFYNTLKPYCSPGKTFLAGNTIYQDRIFLRKYMPKVDSLFHYRLIDVSTVKELVNAWYPYDQHRDFSKNKNHRALDDIYESMAELSHYRSFFFK